MAGTVGQRFIVLLSSHPYFKIHALGASARSAGQPYVKATKWKQPVPIPQAVRQLVVKECKSSEFDGCEIVFSGLDHDVAGPIGACLLALLSCMAAPWLNTDFLPFPLGLLHLPGQSWTLRKPT